MYGLLVFLALVVVLFGCAEGRWVKVDASSVQTQQDYAECETISSLQPPPATLAEKRQANPDLSSVGIQKCMKNKGYQWVIGDVQPPLKELLEIAPLQNHPHK